MGYFQTFVTIKIEIMNNIHAIMRNLFALSLITLVMSGCSFHKSMISSVNAVIYDNDSVTTKAEFPGGQGAYRKYINNNFDLSNFRAKHTAEGLGIYSFIINQDGKVVDVKVVQPIGTATDVTMIRLLRKMPKWKPATLNGTPVCTRVKLFRNFRNSRNKSVYDIAPYFPGGTEALEPLLVGYSERDSGIVHVSCIIDEEGKVVEPELIDGLSFHANQEALNLVRSLPKWKPAIKNGKPIRVKRTLAVYFYRF